MTSIRLIFGHQEFALTQARNDKFRFISADRSLLADTFAEGISFANFEVELRAEQIREYNADFPEGEPISLFHIPREIEGKVNLNRMEFNCGVYAGDTPYTAENFEF